MNQTTPHVLSPNQRAYLMLTITALCWGGNAVFGRMAVSEASPMALVSLRWLGVLVLMSLFARRWIRRDWRILKNHLTYVISMGVLGFTAFNALFYVAAHSTTMARDSEEVEWPDALYSLRRSRSEPVAVRTPKRVSSG